MNKNIHLIYSNNSSVEMEYLKRFLEFIGFNVTIFPFNSSNLDSLYNIMNHSEKNCGKAIEIVLNYFELNDDPFSDKYLYEIAEYNCEQYGIERFYLYFNFDDKFFYIDETPLIKTENIDKDNDITKSELRYNVLNNLIEKIFKNNEPEKKFVKDIFNCYFKCDNEDFLSNDDMFYLLSAKNNLDIINWDEFNNVCYIDKIYLEPYIYHIIERLLELYKITYNKNDYFSLYTNINSALNIFDILNLLDLSDIYFLGERDKLINEIISDYDNDSFILSKYNQLIENVSSNYDLINLLFLFKGVNNAITSDLINILMNEEKKITEYSKVYLFLGNCELHNEYIENINDFEKSKSFKYFNLAKIYNPLLSEAYYKLGENYTICGEFKRAESELNNLDYIMYGSYNIDIDRDSRNSISYDILKNLYKKYNLLGKIGINSCREYLALTNIRNQAFLTQDFKDAILEHNISDCNEKSFQKFLDYQKDSLPVYKLYKELELWADIFKNNCDLKAILNDADILKKYKSYK